MAVAKRLSYVHRCLETSPTRCTFANVRARPSVPTWIMPIPSENAEPQGLSIRLYHPESCPFDTFVYVDDDGAYASGLMQARLHAARQPVVRLLTVSRAHGAAVTIVHLTRFAHDAQCKCSFEFTKSAWRCRVSSPWFERRVTWRTTGACTWYPSAAASATRWRGWTCRVPAC